MFSHQPIHHSAHAASGPVLHVAGGDDFAARIVEYVVCHWDREIWPHSVIFLPNKRSVIQIRDAFFQYIGEGAALLPSMIPLAEIDPASLLLLQGIKPVSIPKPIMHTAQRRLLLAKQVEQFMAAQGQRPSLQYALDMADSLAQLLDESVRYGVDMRAIRYLVPDSYSAYWQQSLAFLSIVFQYWPRIEQSFGMVSHHKALVDALNEVATSWETAPPDYPIMVAGSTASQPATARLLRAVVNAPYGVILLPSTHIRDEAYDAAIAPAHPLYHLSAFMRSIDNPPHTMLGMHAIHDNASYVVDAFRPVGSGVVKPMHMPESLIPIACADEWEEARVISLIVREHMESGVGRIMVVSPDRQTLQRVGIALLRWHIIADSSSASRLSEHPFVNWIQALLAMVHTQAAAIESLAFFQHNLSFGNSRALHDYVVERVDAFYARGLSRTRNFMMLNRALISDLPDAYRDAIEPFMASLAVVFRCHKRSASLAEWTDAFMECAHHCGAHSALTEDVSAVLNALIAHTDRSDICTEELILLIKHVCDVPWFAATQAMPHPRVFLHTPIEARLQSAECVVLAGLNEGVWPCLPNSPWLNQTMRVSLKLPTYEHELSLQAHDFLGLASHALVYLTRPVRVQQAVSTPSRWWQRLMLMRQEGENRTRQDDTALCYIDWARRMDEAALYQPAPPPMPNPPVTVRPHQLRATQMEDLITNPYAVYARSILNLEPLDTIDRQPDASLLGTLMHALLEKMGTAALEVSDAEMMGVIDAALERYSGSGKVLILWRKRLLSGLRFFIQEHQSRARMLKNVEAEVPLHFDLPVDGTHIRFRGRADRIEHYRDGRSAVIDFKTGGNALSHTKILSAELPQLSVYHMAEVQRRYGMDFAAHLGNVSLSYWVMPHGADEGKIIETPILSLQQTHGILTKFQSLVKYYIMEQHPMMYAPSMVTGRYGYSALARAAEWGGPDSPEGD